MTPDEILEFTTPSGNHVDVKVYREPLATDCSVEFSINPPSREDLLFADSKIREMLQMSARLASITATDDPDYLAKRRAHQRN